MHINSEPSILYFGTPVVLVTSENEDGSCNVAPISSAFWLGWRCVIGIGTNTQTAGNLKRKRACVLNLPSVAEVGAVDRLAMLTGRNPVPERKQRKGYRFEPDKFTVAGLTPMESHIVSVPSIRECPVHLEAVVTKFNSVGEDEDALKDRIVAIELKIVNVRIEETILKDGHTHRVDPDKWRPLIMSFQQYYGLGTSLHPSALAQIPEHLYKTDLNRRGD